MRNLFLSLFLVIFLVSFGFCQERDSIRELLLEKSESKTAQDEKPAESQPKPSLKKKKTELKYNPYTGEFEEVPVGQSPKYLPKKYAPKENIETKKKKITPSATSQERYNPVTGEFEEAKSTETLRYDPVGDSWSYEDEQAEHRYNPYTGEIERAGSSEELQYNPQSGTWSYE